MYCDTSILGIYIYMITWWIIYTWICLPCDFTTFGFLFNPHFGVLFETHKQFCFPTWARNSTTARPENKTCCFSFFWFCWSWHVVTVLFYSVNTFDPSNCWEINSWTFTSTLHADGCANIRNIRPTRSWFLKVRKHLKLLADLADRCLFWAWENRMCCTFGWCFLHQGADPVKKNG